MQGSLLSKFRPTVGKSLSIVSLILLFFVTLMPPPLGWSAEEVDISQYVQITTSNERSTLNRVTRTLTSTADITITNISTQTIHLPLHAIVDIQGASYEDVEMPNALGGYLVGPYGKYYYEWTDAGVSTLALNFGKSPCEGHCTCDWDKDGDVDGTDLSLAAKGGRLSPGDSFRFRIKFKRPSDVTFTYSLKCYGMLEQENAAPVAEAGENRTYTLDPGQRQIQVSLDGTASTDTDGTIAQYIWTGSPDPEDIPQPLLNLSAGTYVFTLVVIDDDGAQSLPDQVTIIVQEAGAQEVHPPVLTIGSTSYSVDEGSSLNIEVSASDEDGDPVVISASPKLENATFSMTPGTEAAGTFAFNPDFTQQGIYQILFTARDPSGYVDQKTIQIMVNDVNHAPVVSVNSPVEVNEGSILTVPVKVLDQDGDLVSVTAENLPDNAIFVAPTRTLTFTPDFDQAGEYDITFEADDGKEATTGALHVSVKDVQTGGGETRGLVLEVDPVQSPTLLTTQRITGRVNVGGPAPQAVSSGLITGLDPSTGKQGETVQVRIIGRSEGNFATHFSADTSQLDFGQGITVNSLTIENPHQATASITISPDAELGSRAVTMITGNEHAVSMVAFNVQEGTTAVSGRVIDPATGQPVSGALVTVQGIGITGTTNSDGSFTLTDVPAGEHTLVITAQNHEPITISINPKAGTTIDLGNMETNPTVFDPSAAPSVSVISVVGRGIGEVLGGTGLEELKQIITDTMLLVGGSEAGVIDEYGNQLNPQVQGDGLVSLTPSGIRLIAQKMQRGGETVGLGDLLFAFSFGLKWTEGSPLPLEEWIEMLQTQVNAAWADPANPENAMIVIIFNRGTSLALDPPVLSPDTRLNPMQAFLFTASLWTFIHSQSSTQVGAARKSLSGFASLKKFLNRYIGNISAFLVPTAYADDGDAQDQNKRFTRFWRNAFQYKTNFLTTTIQPAYRDVLSLFSTLCIPSPDITAMQMTLGAKWPVVGAAIDTLDAVVRLTYYASNIPSPPPANSLRATVTTDDHGKKQVEVSFKISPSHKRGNFSARGKEGGYTYIYSLYRGSGGHGRLELISQLIVTPDTYVLLEDPSKVEPDIVPISWVAEGSLKDSGKGRDRWSDIRFKMLDPNPLPLTIDSFGNVVEAPYATWFYTITLAKITGLSDVISKQALRATTPWWGNLMGGGISSYGPFADYTKNIMVSDYSVPLIVTINSSGETKLTSIEVDPKTGDVYLSDPYGSDDIPGAEDPAFYRVPAGGTGKGELFVKSGFKKLPNRLGHKGLAVDSDGNIYTVNTASEDQYGGRIFRFGFRDGTRDFVGSINYFSRMLYFAQPTSAGPIAIGLGSDPHVSTQDLYVVDQMAGELKDVPVNASFDPYRRVGQFWASIPFSAQGIDLEFDRDANAVLLVQRVPSPNLSASLLVSRDKVAIDETFKITLTIENPSSQVIQDVLPTLHFISGGEKLTLIAQSSVEPVTLNPGATADFTYEYQALASGVVTIQGQAQGADPSGVTISSPLIPPSGLDVIIGCPIVIDQISADPSRVGIGETVTVTMKFHNEGAHSYTNVVPQIHVADPLGGTDQRGKVTLTGGPTPDTVILAPDEAQEFTFTFEGASLGKLAFEGTVTGTNSETGNTETSLPRLSNAVLISPVSITLEADPESVEFVDTESTTVTLTVENTSTNPIYEVVPSLTWMNTDGQFETWEEPDLSPVTLQGGETRTYTYTLRKPISSGAVVLKGCATAKTQSGAVIPVDPVRITVTIGPALIGHVYDVKLNGHIGIQDYIDGKDLDKPMKLWVDDVRALQTTNTIKAIPFVYGILDETQAVESEIDPGDGSYALALPGPGTYEIRLEGVEGSDIGFRAIIRDIGNESVERDFKVPHSLVMQTKDLIEAFKKLEIKIDVGGFEDISGITPTVVTYPKLPDSIKEYLKLFQKGLDSPRYERLWEGISDDREVTHPSVNWDALIRLDAALLFSLRRFYETSSLVVETIKDIMPFILMTKSLKEFYDKFKRDNEDYFFTNYKFNQANLFAPHGKIANLLLKVYTNSRAAWSNPTTKEDERYLNATNALLGWLGEIADQISGLEGLAIDELLKAATVYVTIQVPTSFYMNKIFVRNNTEPVLEDAVVRATVLDLAGSTRGVLKDLEKLDEFIVKQTKEDKNRLAIAKQSQGAFKDFADAMEVFRQRSKTLNAMTKGGFDPGRFARFMFEVGPLIKKFSAAFLALQAVDVMETLIIGKPGQVCVGANQAFSATPNIMLSIPAEFIACSPGRRVR